MKCDDLPKGKADDETLTIERRSGEDRRKTEVSALGLLERRKKVDPRQIKVVEVELTEADWEELFGKQKG